MEMQRSVSIGYTMQQGTMLATRVNEKNNTTLNAFYRRYQSAFKMPRRLITLNDLVINVVGRQGNALSAR